MAATTIDRTAYTALVDDDGTNTTGTVASKSAALGTPILDPLDAMFNGAAPFYFGGAIGVGRYTTTTTGTKNDWDIDTDAGLAVGHLRCNNASLLTITGFKAPSDNRLLWITSVGAGQVDLKNQDTGSATAGNRIINQATGTISLAAGVGMALLMYDVTTARWRTFYHSQGAFITPTFAAGDYTASGSMTWTLAAGDVTTCAYYLDGRRLTVILELVTTTVGGTVNTALQRAIPGGFTAAKEVTCAGTIISDNGGANTNGAWRVQAAATVIQFFRDLTLTANWTLATDTTKIFAKCEFEVQ